MEFHGDQVHAQMVETRGVSNRWNGIWYGTMEWKMKWNGKHTQLQLTRVTGAAQSRLNCLVYLTAEAL